jgi:flagellar assembly protein FliH
LSENVEGAQAVGIGSLAGIPIGTTSFRARFADGQEISGYRPQTMGDEQPLDAMEQARADAFAQGFDAGARVTNEAMAADVEARDRLTRAVEQLAPAQNGALSSMLSAAVMRLVGQIVGEVPVDADLLRSRCATVAGFIEAEQGRNSLHVHPDDIALLDGCDLGVALVADEGMSRGSIRLDTSDGWIEDGPDIQLSRLKAMLDDMEGKA